MLEQVSDEAKQEQAAKENEERDQSRDTKKLGNRCHDDIVNQDADEPLNDAPESTTASREQLEFHSKITQKRRKNNAMKRWARSLLRRSREDEMDSSKTVTKGRIQASKCDSKASEFEPQLFFKNIFFTQAKELSKPCANASETAKSGGVSRIPALGGQILSLEPKTVEFAS